MKNTLLSLRFDDCSTEEWETLIRTMLESEKPNTLYTPNAEIACHCARDPGFCALIGRGSAIAPDGEGVILGARLAGTPFVHGKRAGVELGMMIARICAREGAPLFLFGGAEGVAEEAAAALCRQIPSLSIVGTACGFGYKPEVVAKQIRASGARAVFVCLGSPRQEEWIDAYKEISGASLLIGLGGSLDVYAGRVRRAPKRWIDARLEWLWRLKENPRRLSRMLGIPIYLGRCFLSRKGRISE